MARGVMRLPWETLGVLSIVAGYFLALFGFFVEPVMGGGEDFGEVADVELLDEPEGDGAFIFLRPPAKAANKSFNHCSGFTF